MQRAWPEILEHKGKIQASTVTNVKEKKNNSDTSVDWWGNCAACFSIKLSILFQFGRFSFLLCFLLFQKSNYTWLLFFISDYFWSLINVIVVSIYLKIILNFDLFSLKLTMFSIFFFWGCVKGHHRAHVDQHHYPLPDDQRSRRWNLLSIYQPHTLMLFLFSKMRRKKNPFPNQC